MKKTRISDTRVTVSRRSTRAGPRIARALGLLLVLLLTAVPVLAASYDLTTLGSSATINGAIFQQLDPTGPAGSGVFNAFVRIQHQGNNTVEQGYNTDGTLEFDTKAGAHTHPLLLSDVPKVTFDTTVYREFVLDVDEKSSDPFLSLDELQLFTASSSNLTGYSAGPPPSIGGATTLVYDLGDNTVKLNYALNEGSGKADYLVYIPSAWFGSDPNTWVYLFSRFGDNFPVDDGFEEWGVRELGVDTGELEVVKDVFPDDPDTNWVMTATGPTPFDDTLHGDDTTGPRTVQTGAYTIVETAGSGTNLADYNTTYACTVNGGTGPVGSGTTINVTVGKGETAVCTFTNTRKQGSLEVVKDVVPDDPTTNWVMTATGPTPFNDTLNGDATTGPQTVQTGAYTIVETAGSGTNLADYNTTYACTVNGGTGPVGSGTTINVTVGEGETVVCTFTNTEKPPEPGTLEVVKDVFPDDPTTNWVMTVTGPTPFNDTLTGDATTGPQTVQTGAYTIVETAGSGTNLADYNTSYACTVNGATGPVGFGTTINVTVGEGETVVCTFTNTEKPTAITLPGSSLNAEASAGRVTLTWETGTEMDNAGFNLYRAMTEDGAYTKVNDALIAAEGEAVSGASYSFVDELDYGTYYYKLEDVDLYGMSTLHGPVKVTVARPLRRPLYRPALPEF